MCVERSRSMYTLPRSLQFHGGRGVDYLCFFALSGLSYISHLASKNYFLNLIAKRPAAFCTDSLGKKASPGRTPPAGRGTHLRGDVERDGVQPPGQQALGVCQGQRDAGLCPHSGRGHDQALRRDSRRRQRRCGRQASSCGVKFYKRGEVSR